MYYDAWQDVTDFSPGQQVHYLFSRFPAPIGTVVAVHPKLQKLDVRWPTGERRMDPWDLVSTGALTLATKTSENLRGVLVEAKNIDSLAKEPIKILTEKFPKVSQIQLKMVLSAVGFDKQTADWKAIRDSLALEGGKHGLKVAPPTLRTDKNAVFRILGHYEDAKFESFIRLEDQEDGVYSAELLSLNVKPPVDVDIAVFKGLEGSAASIVSQFMLYLKEELEARSPVTAAPNSVVVDTRDYRKKHKKTPSGRADWSFQDDRGNMRTIKKENYPEAEKQIKQYAEGKKLRRMNLVPGD